MPSPSSAAESSASSTTGVSWSPPPPPPPSPLTLSWKTGQGTLRGFIAPHRGSLNPRRALPPQTQRRRLNQAIWTNNRPLQFSASSQTPCRTICSQDLNNSTSSSNICLLVWRTSSARHLSLVQECLLQDTTWEDGAPRLHQNHTATPRPHCLRRRRRRRTAVLAAWN